jgi:WD40 repeat protein
MLRWLVTCGIIVVLATGGFYLLVGAPRPADSTPPSPTDAPRAGAAKKPIAKGQAQAPEAPVVAAAGPQDRREPLPAVAAGAQPVLTIPEGRVTAIDRQEVPAQHDGQILFIGTELTKAEASKLPPERRIRALVGGLWVQLAPGDKERFHLADTEIQPLRVPVSRISEGEGQDISTDMQERQFRRLRDEEEVSIIRDKEIDPHRVQVVREERWFRRLQEGDEVAEGQLLGMINPSLAVDELAIKKAKLNASVADLVTAQKTRDEAEQRYKTNRDLYTRGGRVVSLEDLRGSELTWKRYSYESISKYQAISVAASELKQAQTTLEMHDLRSKIPGRIKAVYKNKGDAVKNLDPVLQVFNPNKLRIEGLVEMQYVGLLKEGMDVVVEPTRFMRHDKLFRGHLQEITGVAVSKNNEIVSASEDRTVRVWDRNTGEQKLLLQHPTPVHAVACTPAGSEANLCLTAANDGIGRLYDLDAGGGTPVHELRSGHSGPINCVAFGPQGKWCATGGDDKVICLWDAATGNMIQRFTGGQKNLSAEAAAAAGGHRGAVTSLAFLSTSRLVSAGKDNVLLVWNLNEDGSRAGPPLPIDRRSGDVASLGVNPLKQEILFDYGRELRVLTVPDQKTKGVLQTPSGAMNFSTLAHFSPDGQLILTAGGAEGRLQLWHAPTDKRRAYELCQLISPAAATSGAFAPDGSFLVTGTRDRQVLVWKAPTKEESAELKAKVKFVEKSLDSNSRQVRIWADLEEPQGLISGGMATMVVYP